MKSIWDRWREKKSSSGAELDLAARLSFELSRLDRDLWQQLLKNTVETTEMKAYWSSSLALDYGGDVSIEQELDLLQRYMQLWQLADKNIHVTFSVQYEGQNLYISPLILFPLLQNALQSTYFMSDRRPIKCRVRIVGDLLYLEISNRVNPYLQSQAETEVMNLFRLRLQVAYPGQHDLIISSNSNLFRATLQLRLSATANGSEADKQSE